MPNNVMRDDINITKKKVQFKAYEQTLNYEAAQSDDGTQSDCWQCNG